MPSRSRTLVLAALVTVLCSGCAVVSVATTAVSIVGTGASLAVDATVGTVKAVGSAASAVLPGKSD
jgi:uncharacterized cupredoxin-like copper-binding protein